MRAFLSLARHRSFTRAAAECHLSQPAFSDLIRVLEETLGARLFDRTTRSIELTPEGQRFESSARALLREFDGVLGDLSDHVAMRRGRVAVAALPSLDAQGVRGLPRRLAGRGAGALRCALRAVRGDGQVGQGGFRAGLHPGQRAGAERRALLLGPLLPRLPQGASAGAEEDGERGRRGRLALYPALARQHLDAAIFPRQMQTVLEVEHLATVTGMVEAGFGVSLVPGLTLFHFERDTLAIRPLSSRGAPPPRRAVYLVTRRDRSLSVAAQALVEAVRAQRPAERRAAG